MTIDKSYENAPPSHNFDEAHYLKWRVSRINKLVSILGKDWFPNKHVLEIACGWGQIGHELGKMGAIMTLTTGHKCDIPNIKERNPGSNIYVIDHEKQWHLGRKFDLVIHWGMLMHLKNWRDDIIRSLSHTKEVMSLEAELCDSTNLNFEIEVAEWWKDGSIHHKGTRVPAGAIENILRSQNVNFTRYDDADLNADFHLYDWEDGIAPDSWRTGGLNRFWIIRKDQ